MTNQHDELLQRLLETPRALSRINPALKAEHVIDAIATPLASGLTQVEIHCQVEEGTPVYTKTVRYKRQPLGVVLATKNVNLSTIGFPTTAEAVAEALTVAGVTIDAKAIDVSRSTATLLIIDTTDRSVRYEGTARFALDGTINEPEPEIDPETPPSEPDEGTGEEPADETGEPGKTEPNTPQEPVVLVPATSADLVRDQAAFEANLFTDQLGGTVSTGTLTVNAFETVVDHTAKAITLTLEGNVANAHAEAEFITPIYLGNDEFVTYVNGLVSADDTTTVVARLAINDGLDYQTYSAAQLLEITSLHDGRLAVPYVILAGSSTGPESLLELSMDNFATATEKYDIAINTNIAVLPAE